MSLEKLSALITGIGLHFMAVHLPAQESHKVDRHIASRVLGQERTITIGLPANYDIARRRYPAVYLLDGEQRSLVDLTIAATAFDMHLDAIDHVMPPHIVVGIEQANRGVEFGRSSASFLQFLTEEVVPGVERDFRTNPLRILIGHSLAGRFAIEALCRGGRTFAAAIAISPAIGDSAALRRVIACLTTRALADSGRLTQLVVSSGNRPGDDTEAQFRPYQLALRAWLADSAPPNLRWTFLDLPGFSHSQTPYFSIPHALWFVHDRAIWEPPVSALDSVLAGTRPPAVAINEFYSMLSRRVGFTVPVDSKWLNILAWLNGSHAQWAEAIDAARRAVELYPEEIDTHLGLADVLAQSGDKPAAMRALNVALHIVERLAGSEGMRRDGVASVRGALQTMSVAKDQ